MFELAKGDSEMSNRLLTTSPDVATSTNLTGFINRRWVPHQPSQPAAAKNQQPAVLKHSSLCNHPRASACMGTCSSFAHPAVAPPCSAFKVFARDAERDGFKSKTAMSTVKWDTKPSGQHVELGIVSHALKPSSSWQR